MSTYSLLAFNRSLEVYHEFQLKKGVYEVYEAPFFAVLRLLLNKLSDTSQARNTVFKC